MAGDIKINTKYAKRDVERMEKAATALEEAEKKYKELQIHIESVYKGGASMALVDAVAMEASKCKSDAQKLRIAEKDLKDTIRKFEEYNEKMVNTINSSKG